MARVRYDVVVYARRGTQTAYTYVQHRGVRPGRLEKLFYDTAVDILQHETRGEFTGYLTTYPTGAIVVVGGRECCRFIVRARRA